VLCCVCDCDCKEKRRGLRGAEGGVFKHPHHAPHTAAAASDSRLLGV
jgi:hypothetical protein